MNERAVRATVKAMSSAMDANRFLMTSRVKGSISATPPTPRHSPGVRMAISPRAVDEKLYNVNHVSCAEWT
jgi:hypothetical protein